MVMIDTYCRYTYNDSLEKGYSQCLSPACVEVSTTYKNHVVEMFEQRLIKFLTRKITSVLPDEDDKEKIVEEYCCPKACGLPFSCPNLKLVITEEQKERIEIECGKLLELTMRWPVAVSSLAASPGSYMPMLKYLMVEYEKEHEEDQHSKNVASEELANGKTEITSEQQESNNLPRLFSLTSEPSVKFGFISITPIGLKAFTPKFKKLYHQISLATRICSLKSSTSQN